MYVFYFLGLFVVGLVVFFLLRYYPNRQTTLFVKFLVGLAWFASLSIVISVPTDVQRALDRKEGHNVTLSSSDNVLRDYWKVAFWSTLLFSIMVMPFTQQYSNSGGFYFRDRCEYSLRRNLKILLAVLVVLVSGLALLFIIERELAFSKFVGWLMAALNAYGMLGAICLLGFGLVDIPRQLWFSANLPRRMQVLYESAGLQLEKTADAHLELSKQINSVRLFDGQYTRTDAMRPYMDIIVGMIDRVPGFEPQETEENQGDYKIEGDSHQGLAVLRQRLRTAIEGYDRERERYLSLIKEYLNLHDTVENTNRFGLPFQYSDGRETGVFLGHLLWLWRCRIKQLAKRFLAIITGLLSVVIVVAEVTIPEYLPNMSLFGQLLQKLSKKEVPVLICTFLMLLYVMTCSYYTLFRMGRFSFYLLVPQHTAPFSLASNALLMCRFACPLCFNFLTAVALPIKDNHDASAKGTQFWRAVGHRISETPVLGKYFTTYLPMLMLPYVLLIAFNAINKVMAVLDPKKRFSFQEDWKLLNDDNHSSTGKAMLNLELEHYQRGWDLGLTITEGLRRTADYETGSAHFKRTQAFTSIPPTASRPNENQIQAPWVGQVQYRDGDVLSVKIPTKGDTENRRTLRRSSTGEPDRASTSRRSSLHDSSSFGDRKGSLDNLLDRSATPELSNSSGEQVVKKYGRRSWNQR
eukprot:g4982.t1